MTIAQQLKIKEFPFIIRNKDGDKIYYETSKGKWTKSEYDSNAKQTYYEDYTGYCIKYEYDSNGNLIYWENSEGSWSKGEYGSNGNLIYWENSDEGVIRDNRPKTVEPTNSQSITAWETKITSLVKDYKQLTAACDAASDAGVLDTDGKLYTAIWSAYDNMLDRIDVNGWISWYIFDNDCGAKRMEAGFDGTVNAIKTPLDLARIMVIDEKEL